MSNENGQNENKQIFGSSRVLVEPAKPWTSPKYNLLIHNKSLPCPQPARQAKTYFEGPVPQEPAENQIFDNKWLEAIRDLIEHENTLTINRVGWIGTFQGFLIAALPFTWDRGIGLWSLTMLLCIIGFLFSILSFLSLIRANRAIKNLVEQWSDYKRRLWGDVSLKFFSDEKKFENEAKEDKSSIVIASIGCDLRLMSVTTADGLENEGRNLVIVAFVGTNLHIRIFDANGKRVVDKAEDKLISGETLTTLKKQLNPLPEESSLSSEQKQQIIRDATSMAGHTPSISNNLRIRIFDAEGNIVINKVQSELAGGERLEIFKKLLKKLEIFKNPIPKEESKLSPQDKQDIIRNVTSVAANLPPVWGMISEQELGSWRWLINKPFEMPWLFLPVVTFFMWSAIGGYQSCFRGEPKPEWQVLAQDKLKQALSYNDESHNKAEQDKADSSRVLMEPAKPGTSPKYNPLIHNKSLPRSQPTRQAKTHFEGPVPQEPSKNHKAEEQDKAEQNKADEAITTLVRIHGDAADGEKVFNNFCFRCHNGTKAKSSEELAKTLNRDQIVSGILYPSSHRNLNHKEGVEKEVMENDLTTSMSTRQFANVVEYISSLKPK